MNYTIIRKDLDSVLITTNGVNSISIKVVNIDPHTKVEDAVSLTFASDVDYTESNGYYVITTTASYSIPVILSNDGVYFIYVKDAGITYKHLIVNTKKVTNYITTTAQNNICCCPVRDCKHTVFSNKDYVFNVISNLCFSFIGWEFEDVGINYGAFGSGQVIKDVEYQAVSVGDDSPTWATQEDVVIFYRKDNAPFNEYSSLIPGKVYVCTITGTPQSYGGSTFTRLTTELQQRLYLICEILFRVNEYLLSDTTNNCSTC